TRARPTVERRCASSPPSAVVARRISSKPAARTPCLWQFSPSVVAAAAARWPWWRAASDACTPTQSCTRRYLFRASVPPAAPLSTALLHMCTAWPAARSLPAELPGMPTYYAACGRDVPPVAYARVCAHVESG
ncbi:hypothetical protein LPMP_081060, partial [Leishmania panamensis]